MGIFLIHREKVNRQELRNTFCTLLQIAIFLKDFIEVSLNVKIQMKVKTIEKRGKEKKGGKM